MKIKTMSYIATGILITLPLCLLWSVIGFTNNKAEAQNLFLKGKVNKKTFTLGEPVKVEFEFVNDGETAVVIPNGGVEVGSLRIFIAGKDGEYKRYAGPRWGRKMPSPFTLEPKKSYKYQESVILWNGKPNVSHLNADAAKRYLEGKITTEYALPEPGVYFIKGVSYVGENETPIESEPIQVLINEPTGDDLKVWNQIKGNRHFSFLIQEGNFLTSKDEEKEKLIKEVEKILETYPNSTYSGYLKPSLKKYKVNEEKRREVKEKIQQQKKN